MAISETFSAFQEFHFLVHTSISFTVKTGARQAHSFPWPLEQLDSNSYPQCLE